jgi:hypothetical protein
MMSDHSVALGFGKALVIQSEFAFRQQNHVGHPISTEILDGTEPGLESFRFKCRERGMARQISNHIKSVAWILQV